MEFEDIAHKYILYPVDISPVQAEVMLWHVCKDGKGATVGWFKNEVMARNVALALEFYKEQNMTSEHKQQNIEVIKRQMSLFERGKDMDQAGALEDVYNFLQEYFPREFPSSV